MYCYEQYSDTPIQIRKNDIISLMVANCAISGMMGAFTVREDPKMYFNTSRSCRV